MLQENHHSIRMEDGLILGDGSWTSEQKPRQHIWASKLRQAKMVEGKKRHHEVLVPAQTRASLELILLEHSHCSSGRPFVRGSSAQKVTVVPYCLLGQIQASLTDLQSCPLALFGVFLPAGAVWSSHSPSLSYDGRDPYSSSRPTGGRD